MSNTQGFTLIELLVVVLIIGILAAVAVPQYQLAVYKSRLAAVRPLVDKLVAAEEAYYLANGTYTRNVPDLDIAFFSSCTYEEHPDWAYNTLSCPGVMMQVFSTGVVAYIRKCPVGGGACIAYRVGFSDKKPVCSPYLAGDEKVLSYGSKVCASLGTKNGSDHFGDKYYL